MSRGPFYFASVPVAVKDPTFSQCKTCRRFTDASLKIGRAVRASVGYYISTTVCLPGAKIEDVTEKAGQVMGGATGGAVLVHVGTNNAEKEGTSAIVGKYRRLAETLKEARIGQIVLPGMLPVMRGRGEVYRICRRIAINTKVQKV